MMGIPKLDFDIGAKVARFEELLTSIAENLARLTSVQVGDTDAYGRQHVRLVIDGQPFTGWLEPTAPALTDAELIALREKLGQS
ncbi:hypothetical protein PBI_INDLOVU_81 [Mycobacterium phage Indlovu]|nr:hypothetical protein PBI_INDLOVU_81 [Mycobacterium phage Indlovu]